MRKSQDIQYIVDAKGRRRSVLLSCSAYEELIQDIADLRAKADRRDEVPEDFERVVAELEGANKLSDTSRRLSRSVYRG